MKRVLVFSGTTEGRRLCEALAHAGVCALACVATEYGRQVMPPLSGIEVRTGRLDALKMKALMEQEPFLAVVDATHPFAVRVSEAIRECAASTGTSYLRLQRNTQTEEAGKTDGQIQYFVDHESCREALLQTNGNVLLTTGSKDLGSYCADETLKKRLYARLLPSEESIALAGSLGLLGRQLIAMQGPFSEEMNLAILRQFDIRHMVTKESGSAGGFEAKVSAAGKLGVSLYVIGNPETTDGLSFEKLCEILTERTGKMICEKSRRSVSLVGIGMGAAGTLSVEAKELIARADLLFGAERLLQCVEEWGIKKAQANTYPYYLAQDILPCLEQLKGTEAAEIVVLFSGDSGFYSGCQNVYRRLREWSEEADRSISVRICPGISSVSYFAAACGISWQDARILSIHGKGDRQSWEAEVLSAIRYHKKVFLLVSGVEDVRAVGELLEKYSILERTIYVGRQLSYPEEEILECTAAQCCKLEKKGLYIMAMVGDTPQPRYLAPQKKDEEFIRGKVPMTKEEIRELVVCKLRLAEGAVVYDIGSGTGSVTVEIAQQSENVRVYAIEQKEEGVHLIRENKNKFGLPNIEVIHGKAPDCLEALPAPTHAFIGGSSGNLKDIMRLLYQKNPSMRVVLTAITIETMSEWNTLIKDIPHEDEELIQIQVSRAKKLGAYHLMQAENPIYIGSLRFVPEKSV